MTSDRAARRLLKRDLSAYMTRENFVSVTFEFQPKTKSITLRLSEGLLRALKGAATKHGTNYQRLVRLAIERFLRTEPA
ncbi:MAG: CopG family antitoxin [Pseudomonadota bacterium]